ncbi:hypothetical protein BJ322DRAFT_1000561 [Thelephora terrestris]|uniref:CxC2-like cysteine cluster KDZ transposase-associated domain-containing protein n=1 Tax=Thelephora terrestris TaxID=56493 RepID=A0A9P6HL55_9AGAM|nr:hypothetical protein BJ322DRAFT_1000561 [Thelephora terrestris]
MWHGRRAYRCPDCFSAGFSCRDCLVLKHSNLPLHRIQQWEGNFFIETSLFDLGASYQLGHDIDDTCLLPSDYIDLVLFDTSGVHAVRVTFCFCNPNGAQSCNRRVQLLRARWFPASWSHPGTAFTFRLLDFLHKLQTRSKINLYDFHASLASITNSAGLRPPMYRYNELALVLRIWVYLRQARRGGGSHISGGFEALALGSLAVECPTCPNPGKNLVSPQVDSWLNTLYLSMDTNFKLKQKDRGFSDPPLSNRLSFMVPNGNLQEHLAHCSVKKLTTEINTCGSNFNAVSQAYTKNARGYTVTGVGAVDCARHGFKRPNGIVDLQKGERYSNMDFALLSTLIPSLNAGISQVLISYDIGCQWHKNIQNRINAYAAFPPLQLSGLEYWRVVVPKFHISGHGAECQALFNLSYTKWAGRMDGERIESGWAQSTSMATWTRESGPNARRNILDDHWNAFNWLKLLGLRTSLEKNLRRSLAWSRSQREVANLVSQSYSPETVDVWRKMRDEFDLDQSKPNPYKEVENRTTMKQLKLALLKEEAAELTEHGPSPHKVSAGAFFDKAIMIENRRRTLAAREKAKITTARANAEAQGLRNLLSKDLLELRKSQQIYMPGLGPLPEGEDELDESIKLQLPSELSEDERAAWCLPGIPSLEFCFRYAQADNSLSQIRRLRRLLQNVQDQNAKHPSQTQQSISRSKGIFDGLASRVRRAAKQYRHSRWAMMALDPSEQLSPAWKDRFRELEDADLRGPGRESYEKSEGKFQPSWIWMVPQSAGNASNDGTRGTHLNNATPVVNSMRVHWSKCQARAERYEEEVALTVEEMGRTLRYFEWKKSQWLSLQSCREQTDSPPPVDIQRGLHAYACRQAHIYEVLITSFVGLWRKLLVPHNLGSEWLHLIPIVVDPLSLGPSRGHSQQTAKPGLVPASDPSNQPDCPPPSFLATPPSFLSTPPGADMGIDPPVEEDDDGGIDSDGIDDADDDDDYVSDEWEGSDFED